MLQKILHISEHFKIYNIHQKKNTQFPFIYKENECFYISICSLLFSQVFSHHILISVTHTKSNYSV